MTGQSSGRTTWCAPNVYQTTTSVSVMGRSPRVYSGKPAPPKVDAPAKDGKDAKAGAMLAPLCDLPALIQPVLERGYEHGT